MADKSANVQILGDTMSEACIYIPIVASGDTATIDLTNLAYSNGGSADRVAITGIQSNGSFKLEWDADSDYVFFHGSGNINIPKFISPIIIDQGQTGGGTTGNIVVTTQSTNVFIMLKLKKIAGFTGTGSVYKKRSRNIASDGIGGY
tara:strand:+ start:4230 stop:4670 length:441 start_codon:yes stop_codon:yes gene_type:complete